MAPKSTISQTVDKINYKISQDVLETSNTSRILKMMSKSEFLKKTLSQDNQVDQNIKDNTNIFLMLSYLFQSITNKGLYTHEIVNYLVDEIDKIVKQDQKLKNALPELLAEYITVIHMDYSKSFTNNKYKHAKFLMNKQFANSYYEKINTEQNKSIEESYNLNNFLNFNSSSNSISAVKKTVNVHKADGKVVDPTREEPSISAVLLNSDYLRCGAKNALELSAFFNIIPTLEYAKAYPYFNASFILPSVSKSDVTQVFKTATLNQFMFGSLPSSDVTENYNSFENVIVNDQDKIGVKTNLSVFTSPQTMVNMDEKVGHNDYVQADQNQLRITSIHDKTRPFMTLKTFTIDVSPTQGLMSFKTGKMSLVLHDRTRMTDIAPFIKPDLFGSFGAEILVEYGWKHNQGEEKDNFGNYKNPIGSFLNSSRTVEKYMITNSQFSIESNGQVNINLSIAMKGPIDIRQTEISADSEKALQENKLSLATSAYNNNKNSFFRAIKLPSFLASDTDFNQAVALSAPVYKKKTLNAEQKRKLEKFKTEASGLAGFLKTVTFESGKLTFKKETLKRRQTLLDKYFGKTFTSLLKQSSDNKNIVYTNAALQADPESQITALRSTLLNIKKTIQSILDDDERREQNVRSYVESLIGGITTDYFKSKLLSDTISKYKKKEEAKDIEIIGDNYVTLGAIITSLVGTHMSSTGKYNEIQMVYHTVNKQCGLASRIYSKEGVTLNIASIPVEKNMLEAFLKDLFTQKTVLTLESLISQIIVKFVMTKDNPMYGLSDLYRRKEEYSDPVKPVYKNKKFKTRSSLKTPEDRLNYFYYGSDKEIYDVDPKVIPPSIHLSFDTLARANFEGSDTNYEDTICRINIYDRNDNPYQELSTLYNATVMGQSNNINSTLKKAATFLQKYNHIEELKKSLAKAKDKKPIDKKLIKSLKSRINAEIIELGGTDNVGQSAAAIDSRIKKFIVALTDDSDGKRPIFQKIIKDNKTFYTLNRKNIGEIKEKYKKIIPTATFATQNTSLINASVATVNEGKLNTVYITRADRNDQQRLNSKVVVDMPLRILPAQASIEVFGCPWINFGQFIFLDFETGTTIDNTYAVTGIQHTISPGVFRTNVSLSYGDVYGKYQGYADVLSQLLPEDVSGDASENAQPKAEETTKKQKQKQAKAVRQSNTQQTDSTETGNQPQTTAASTTSGENQSADISQAESVDQSPTPTESATSEDLGAAEETEKTGGNQFVQRPISPSSAIPQAIIQTSSIEEKINAFLELYRIGFSQERLIHFDIAEISVAYLPERHLFRKTQFSNSNWNDFDKINDNRLYLNAPDYNKSKRYISYQKQGDFENIKNYYTGVFQNSKNDTITILKQAAQNQSTTKITIKNKNQKNNTSLQIKLKNNDILKKIETSQEEAVDVGYLLSVLISINKNRLKNAIVLNDLFFKNINETFASISKRSSFVIPTLIKEDFYKRLDSDWKKRNRLFLLKYQEKFLELTSGAEKQFYNNIKNNTDFKYDLTKLYVVIYYGSEGRSWVQYECNLEFKDIAILGETEANFIFDKSRSNHTTINVNHYERIGNILYLGKVTSFKFKKISENMSDSQSGNYINYLSISNFKVNNDLLDLARNHSNFKSQGKFRAFDIGARYASCIQFFRYDHFNNILGKPSTQKSRNGNDNIVFIEPNDSELMENLKSVLLDNFSPAPTMQSKKSEEYYRTRNLRIKSYFANVIYDVFEVMSRFIDDGLRNYISYHESADKRARSEMLRAIYGDDLRGVPPQNFTDEQVRHWREHKKIIKK